MTNTISLLLYGASFTKAVTLKSDSYSAESALAQLDETQKSFEECLCFRYRDGLLADPTEVDSTDPDVLLNPQFLYTIKDGGFIENTGPNGKCDIEGEVRQFMSPPWDATGIIPDYDATPLEENLLFHAYAQVTNQSCLYKMWMCSCWASQAESCLCARKNPDETVTMVKPSQGGCDLNNGEGPLLNPKAEDTGGYALACAPNPCLACCACSRGICSGCGDPKDDDEGYGDANCCDCCGPSGGYVCGLGGVCPYGGGGSSYGDGGGNGGGGCGCGGGGFGGGGNGGGGCGGGGGGGSCGGGCISQNVY